MFRPPSTTDTQPQAECCVPLRRVSELAAGGGGIFDFWLALDPPGAAAAAGDLPGPGAFELFERSRLAASSNPLHPKINIIVRQRKDGVAPWGGALLILLRSLLLLLLLLLLCVCLLLVFV